MLRGGQLVEFALWRGAADDLVEAELLRQMAPYLTPAFDRPDAAFSVVLYGKDVTPPRCAASPDSRLSL